MQQSRARRVTHPAPSTFPVSVPSSVPVLTVPGRAAPGTPPPGPLKQPERTCQPGVQDHVCQQAYHGVQALRIRRHSIHGGVSEKANKTNPGGTEGTTGIRGWGGGNATLHPGSAHTWCCSPFLSHSMNPQQAGSTPAQAKRWSRRHCPANERGSERSSPAQAPPQLFPPPVLRVRCVAGPWGAHLASDSSAATGQAHQVTSEGEARASPLRAHGSENQSHECGQMGGQAGGQRAQWPQERSQPWGRQPPGPLHEGAILSGGREREPDGELRVGGLRGSRTQARLTRRGPGDTEEEALNDIAGRESDFTHRQLGTTSFSADVFLKP